jgi:hypothetical protein
LRKVTIPITIIYNFDGICLCNRNVTNRIREEVYVCNLIYEPFLEKERKF